MMTIDVLEWESSFFERAREQFAAYFLRLAQTTKDQTLLETEYPNFIMAATYFWNTSNHAKLILLRDKLYAFMDLRGHWGDSINFLNWAIDAASEMNDWKNVARFTHDKADILNQSGAFEEAESLYKKSERMYWDMNNAEMALRSRHMRSMVVRARGNLEQAEDLCESVIADAEQLGLFQWLAHPYYVRALIARDRGQYSQAEHWIQQSLQKLSETAEQTPAWRCSSTTAPIRKSAHLLSRGFEPRG
jgi:tetratricopeptide (TPR) repeat protein